MVNKKLFKLLSTLIVTFNVLLTSCSSNSSQGTNSGNSSNNGGGSSSNTSHEHTFDDKWEYNDTYHWHSSTCGHDVKANEERHNFTSTVTDPTYEEGGYTTYTCSTCGYSYVDNETDKLEHNYSSSWSYDENSHWHACTDEGYEDLKKDESSHNFTSIVTDPTYEEGGYTTYTCSTCGYSYVDNETDPLFITITRKNYDGTILEVDNNVSYGTTPIYEGTTPIKESDSRYKYTFAGWTPEVVIATKDATYTAVFSEEKITYTIDFDLNGGSSSSYKGPIEVKIFSKDILFFDCVKEDWQFRGWEYNGEKIFDEKGNQLKNVTLVDDMVFKAIYSQTVKLTITTNMPEAGTILGDGEYPYNTYVDVSVTPNQGYKFVGWYYQNTLLSNEEIYKYMMWDKDITLEARFEKEDFNLRIYSNNEDYGLVLLKSNSVVNEYKPEYAVLKEYGSEVTIATYSKSDVRFLGWYDENNNLVTTNAVYTFIMPNYDYSLEAKWNYFTINYNLNGGTNDPNNPNHYSIDDGIINLQDPTKEGYEFVAWKYNDEIIDAIDVNLVQDITLKAIWSPYEYEIKEDDNGKYAVIIGYDDSITDVIIPENIILSGEEIPVKEISQTAFKGNQKVKSITVSNKVTTIDEYAFAGCTDSITTIGSHAFDECSNLTTVTFGENCQLTTIGDYAFRGCSLLTSIYIPDSVTTIGSYAFYGCSSLSSINIPDSVTTIGEYAFWGCSSLTTVTFGENCQLTTIGDYAFRGCSLLTSIYIPDSVTTIGSSAFHGCSLLTSINIPDSVTTIGDSAFRYCFKLTTVTISENSQLTRIGDDTFRGCSLLTSINIPDSVTTIGSQAFDDCSNLTTVTFGENCQLTTIGDYAFLGCSSLTSINIPDSVTTIGDSAFGYCFKLTTVTISENSQLTTIGDDAFRGCSLLTSIYIPDSVTTIGSYAFCGCSSLSSINIPDSVTTIGSSAFSGCSSLTSIYIPNSVTTIGEFAFSNCSNLTTVTISENSQLTTIGDYAFLGCSSLTSIYIPNSVTTIGDFAFSDCSNLTTVTISENSQLTTIGYYAFSGCSSLTSIYIPNSVTSIGDYAFSDCFKLTIYCGASSKPRGWNSDRNDSDRPVVWNCTYDEYLETIA